ncbi:MAG: MFS transporter, partial [Candidatus Atribacteria bacterium]|nr:MFS transporter [Candidatus Atribacteria bacterium]
ESLLASYSVAGREAVRKIEYAVRYGKPLTSFYRMADFLVPVKQDAPGVEEVRIVLPDGTIVYTENGSVSDWKEEEILLRDVHFASLDGKRVDRQVVSGKGKDHLFLPIRDRGGNWIGSIDLVFDQAVITQRLRGPLFRMLWFLLGTLVVGVLVLFLAHSRKFFLSETGEIRRKPFLTVTFLILGISQAFFGWMNYGIYRDGYLAAARDNGALIARIIQRDVNGVVQKGVPYQRLFGLDEYLRGIAVTVPEIARVDLIGPEENILYSTLPSTGPKEQPLDPSYQTLLSLPPQPGGKPAQLSVELSAGNLAGKMQGMILDTLTLVVISFIFMVEMTLLVIMIFGRRKTDAASKMSSLSENESSGLTFLRPMAFILFFAIFMKGSFIPLIMNDLYQPLFGLSKSMVSALPLSLEVLFGGLATFAGGALYDRKGWRNTFFSGLLIVALGTLLSGLSHTVIPFLIARSIAGIGYGFCYISLRSLVNEAPSETERAARLSAFISGLYAGVMSGVAIGALLADRMGFSSVFMVSFFIILLAGGMALVWLPHTAGRRMVTPERSVFPSGVTAKFFANRNVLSLFGLVVIPLTICSVFLDYYFPLFISGQGLSTSQVGRAFLLNGLCIVYLGPWLSQWSDRSFGAAKSVVLSGLIVAGALIFFAVQGTVIAAFLAVILLGISDSFGLVAQNSFFLHLPVTRLIGPGKALGYYDNVRKIGQMVGPVTFASLASTGIIGVALVGLGTLVALVVFRGVSRTERSDILEMGVSQ